MAAGLCFGGELFGILSFAMGAAGLVVMASGTTGDFLDTTEVTAGFFMAIVEVKASGSAATRVAASCAASLAALSTRRRWLRLAVRFKP